MSAFDFVVFALVGASVVAGALRGFLRAAITCVAILIGLVIAARGYGLASALLRWLGIVESSAAANASGFLFIMCVALVCGFAAGQLVRAGLRRARLEWFDRAMGGMFGLLRGLALCSVLYLALTAFPVRISSVTEARTAPVLAEGARLLAAFTSPEMRARFLDEYRILFNDK